MKLRVVAIIVLLSLLLFFGFKKISANKNKEQSTNIEQLNILKYVPENNKLLFISNLGSFNIVNNNEKDTHIVINCSGRGDKDVNTVASSLEI